MHTGIAASIPFFCGFVGSLTAGWFSDLITSGSTNRRSGAKPATDLRRPAAQQSDIVLDDNGHRPGIHRDPCPLRKRRRRCATVRIEGLHLVEEAYPIPS
jgi:hypothetical protein